MMVILEYIVRIMMFLFGLMYSFGLCNKWVDEKEFDIEDIFALLFTIMFFNISIGV